MAVGESPNGARLGGEIRLVIVDSPDVAAPLVGALDAADVGAWVWVQAENSLYWSPRVPDLLGFDARERQNLLGRFLNAVHGDDRPAVQRLVSGKADEDAFALRFRFLASDKRYRWIEMRGRVVRGGDGTLIRQGGTVRDISVEVAVEDERAETAARLEALINAMPFAVWGYSGGSVAELRVTHQNAKSMAWRGNLLGRSLDDLPPDVAGPWRADMAETLQGRVVRVRTTDEVPGLVLDKIMAPVTVHGVVSGIVGISMDVTEEDRARRFEALLTDVTADFAGRSVNTIDAALVTALERIGRFLGATLTTLCEVSDDNWMSVTHQWIDPATGGSGLATEIDGATLATTFADLRANQPVAVRAHWAADEQSVERGFLQQHGLHSFLMVPVRQSDLTLVVLGLGAPASPPVEWPADTVALLRLAGNLLSGVLGRVRAEANQRLIDRRMQDTHRLESLGVLAGGIAHDFNNLLTAILGNASLLRSEHSHVAGISQPLEQIEAASRRAADLCRQMLAYAGRGRLALQPLDLNDVVRQSQALWRRSVPRKTELVVDLAPQLPAVVADAAQLRQLVMNLLLNAVEAVGDRGGTITIATGTRTVAARELARTVFSPELAGGEYASLRVTDTGEGIGNETIERIFDPFFSTRFTGRGLGLSAVAGIVRSHKGAIRVDSVPGAGSTFELLLPSQPAVPLAARADEAAEPLGGAWRTGGTALVVDDEDGVRDLVRNVLERAGMTVVTAADGSEALEMFRDMAECLRLVMVDLTMPGLDGRETLAAMRQIRQDVPAVLMSGYNPDDLACPGTHAFLQKPFTPAGLRAVVRTLLHEDREAD